MTAIRAAQATDGPALVWFSIAETQNVFPMMPAGKGLSDLIETWGDVGGREVAMAAMNDPLAAPAVERHPVAIRPGPRLETNRHVVVVIVNDRPGVLNRVSSLVRARNFNIESLVVGHTERPGISRMTITLRGDDFAVEQMGKQLYRLIDVLKVQDLPEEQLVEHELALVKVRATNHNRAEVLRIIELYKGRVIDVSPDSLIVEHSGTEQEIDSLVALLGGFGIRELVRTGTVAMGRGSSVVDIEQILRAGAVPAVPAGIAARVATRIAAQTRPRATEE